MPGDPGRSITRVGHYFPPEIVEKLETTSSDKQVIDGTNVYETGQQEDAVFDLSALMEVFDSTIEQEDYVMGETAQQSIEAGHIDLFIFGRNEPALHHYHQTFRSELGLPPLERLT